MKDSIAMKSAAFDMVVMGSAGIDVLVRSHARTIVGTTIGSHDSGLWQAYPLGSKLLIEDLDFRPGGAGINVCSSVSRMGLKTAFLGKLGNDQNGDMLYHWLQQHRVTFLGSRGGQSGYSLSLQAEMDRTILAYKGCNDTLQFNELKPWTAGWLYSTTMLGESFAAQKMVFAQAREQGCRIVYNPSPYACRMGLNVLSPLLKNSDVLVLNREEAELLITRKMTDASPEGLFALAQELIMVGPELVAISDGGRGAIIVTGPAYNHEAWYLAPAQNLEIVRITGAGDAFGAGLAVALQQGKPLREAALTAMINAEYLIQKAPNRKSYADHREIARALSLELQKPRRKIMAMG